MSIIIKEGKGRCYISTKEYKRGDIIILELSYSFIITNNYISTCCSYCGYIPINNQIYGISIDDPIRYCSQECLQLDSKLHLIEIKALKEINELGIEGNNDPCLLLVKIAARRKLEKKNKKLKNIKYPLLGRENTFDHIMTLEAPESSLSEEAKQDIYRVATVMSNILESCNLQMSIDEAYKLLLIIQSNAHRIKDSSKNEIALGLFPMVSMLNHSCTPNCYQSYYIDPQNHSPPSLLIRALCDISIGDEICYNYIPLYQSTDIRQGQLFRAYSFICDCKRCLDNKAYDLNNTHTHNNNNNDNNNNNTHNNINNIETNSININNINNNDESNIDRNDFYSYDNIISLPTQINTNVTSFECSTEILTCHSLLTRSITNNNKSAVQSIIKKLTNICSNSNKMLLFHPCNEILLTTYQTISKGCEFLLGTKSYLLSNYQHNNIQFYNNLSSKTEKINYQKYLMYCIGFTILSLGSILKYTKIRNNEVCEFEELIGLCFYHLNHLTNHLIELESQESLTQNNTPNNNNNESQNENNSKLIELFGYLLNNTSNYSLLEFFDIVTVIILLCLKSSNYYYENDPRIVELIHISLKEPFEYYLKNENKLEDIFFKLSQETKIDENNNLINNNNP